MKKLTKEQSIIITGYTRILCTLYEDFHADLEKRLKRPVFTHEFENPHFMKKVKEVYKEDFINLCYTGEEIDIFIDDSLEDYISEEDFFKYDAEYEKWLDSLEVEDYLYTQFDNQAKAKKAIESLYV